MLGDEALMAEIQESVAKGKPLVAPFPREWMEIDFSDPKWLSGSSPIQPASIDLHVGYIYVPSTKSGRLGGEGRGATSFTIKKGNSVIVSSYEWLRLPRNIGGILFPPSALSSKGILGANIGHIDPGYEGPIRLTLINMGREERDLRRGDDVLATLMLFKIDPPSQKGWLDRKQGTAGGEPTAGEIGSLAPDFADLSARIKSVARREIGKSGWKVALYQWGLPILVALFIGFGAYFFQTYQELNEVRRELVVLKNADLDQKGITLSTKFSLSEALEELEQRLVRLEGQFDKSQRSVEAPRSL